MSATPAPDSPRNLSADEVDELVEFADSGEADGAEPRPQDRRPVLTDVVDDFVDFSDSPAPGSATDGRQPAFVDAVDRLVECSDTAAEHTAGHAEANGKVGERPAREPSEAEAGPS